MVIVRSSVESVPYPPGLEPWNIDVQKPLCFPLAQSCFFADIYLYKFKSIDTQLKVEHHIYSCVGCLLPGV